MTNLTTLLQKAFGVGVFLLSAIAIGIGGALLLQPMTHLLWVQVILAEVAFFAFLSAASTMAFGVDPYQLVQSGGGGGAVGWVLAEALWQALGVSSAGMSLMRLLSLIHLAADLWFYCIHRGVAVCASAGRQHCPRKRRQLPSAQHPSHSKPWETAPQLDDALIEAKPPRSDAPTWTTRFVAPSCPCRTSRRRPKKNSQRLTTQNIESNAVSIKADDESAKQTKPAKPYVRPNSVAAPRPV